MKKLLFFVVSIGIAQALCGASSSGGAGSKRGRGAASAAFLSPDVDSSAAAAAPAAIRRRGSGSEDEATASSRPAACSDLGAAAAAAGYSRGALVRTISLHPEPPCSWRFSSGGETPSSSSSACAVAGGAGGTPVASPEASPLSHELAVASLQSTADVGSDLAIESLSAGEQSLLNRFLSIHPKKEFDGKTCTIARLRRVETFDKDDRKIQVSAYAVVQQNEAGLYSIAQYGYVVEQEGADGVWRPIFIGYAEPQETPSSKIVRRNTTAPVHFFTPDSKFNDARTALHEKGVDWWVLRSWKYTLKGWHKYCYDHSSPRKYGFLVENLGLSKTLAQYLIALN